MGYVSNNETLRTGDNLGYVKQWRCSDSGHARCQVVRLLGVAPGERDDHPPKNDDQ